MCVFVIEKKVQCLHRVFEIQCKILEVNSFRN